MLCSIKKHLLFSCIRNRSFSELWGLYDKPLVIKPLEAASQNKGKAILSEDFSAVNGANNHLPSSIDKGKFSAFAGILNKPVVEAEAPLFAGVSSKEVLHLPVISSLEEFPLSAHVSAYSNFYVLVPVKDVLKALGISLTIHLGIHPSRPVWGHLLLFSLSVWDNLMLLLF